CGQFGLPNRNGSNEHLNSGVRRRRLNTSVQVTSHRDAKITHTAGNSSGTHQTSVETYDQTIARGSMAVNRIVCNRKLVTSSPGIQHFPWRTSMFSSS